MVSGHSDLWGAQQQHSLTSPFADVSIAQAWRDVNYILPSLLLVKIVALLAHIGQNDFPVL
jgi:hypothetical protein